MVKLKIYRNTQGRLGGKIVPLERGLSYEFDESDFDTAATLIRGGVAEICDGPVKVVILYDDAVEGFRRGKLADLSARGAQELIKAYKADFFTLIPQDEKSKKADVTVKILRDTFARGVPLFKDKVYALKPDVATDLLQYKLCVLDGPGPFRIKALEGVIANGKMVSPNAEITLSAEDATELIQKNRAALI